MTMQEEVAYLLAAPWLDVLKHINEKYKGDVRRFAIKFGCSVAGYGARDNWTDGACDFVLRASDGDLYRYNMSEYNFFYPEAQGMESDACLVRWVCWKYLHDNAGAEKEHRDSHSSRVTEDSVYDCRELARMQEVMLFARSPVHYNGERNYFGETCKSIREYYEKVIEPHERRNFPTIEKFVACVKKYYEKRLWYFADDKTREWIKQWLNEYEKGSEACSKKRKVSRGKEREASG